MSFKVIGDSGCDYTEAGGLEWLFRVPLTIELDGNRHTDDDTLDRTALLSDISQSQSVPKTACPSPEEYLRSFDCGADDLYVITLSGELSGSFNSASLAAGMAKERFPGKNIHVFNSLSAAAGETAVCLKVYELASSGLSFADVVDAGEDFIRSLTTVFVLEDLSALRKNGRLSHVQAIVTAALKIRLVMRATAQGTIAVSAKALTSQRAIRAMTDYIKEKCQVSCFTDKVLVITHCNCLEKARGICATILKNCSFKESVICSAGGISTVYASDGGIVVGF
jgi:DegV family protein with EDD domain